MSVRAFSRPFVLLVITSLFAAACGSSEPALDEGPGSDGRRQEDGPGSDSAGDAPGADTGQDTTADGDGPGADASADLPDIPGDMTAETPLQVGTPCERSTDCGLGGVCLSEEAVGTPGGYCTGSCVTAASCGADAECVPGQNGNYCLAGCTADSGCREGYICQAGALGAEGSVCVVGTPGTAGAQPGDTCLADSDCPRAGACLAEEAGFPGGYCILGCDAAVADSCGAGSACVANPNGAAFCVAACSTSTDCRADGYVCSTGLIGLPTEVSVCAPGSETRVPPGSPCTSHGDCTAGTGFCRLDAPGGSCSETCNPASLNPCGGGSTLCLSLAVSGQDPSAGICVAGCTKGGSECQTVRGQDPQAARYACSSEVFGSTLEAGGACVEFTEGAEVGGSCGTTGDCQLGGVCFTQEAAGLAGGYCSDLCDPQGSGETCGAGQVCLNTGSAGICIDSCAQDSDCRTDDGYACRALPGAGSACLPRPCTTVDDCANDALGCLPAPGGGKQCSPCRSSDDCLRGTCAGGRCRLPG